MDFLNSLRLSAPYMLGLSATPVRMDGLYYVVHWFISPTFFEHSLTAKIDVTVRVIQRKRCDNRSHRQEESRLNYRKSLLRNL